MCTTAHAPGTPTGGAAVRSMYDGRDVGISKDRDRRRDLARPERALILLTAPGAKSAPAALMGLGGLMGGRGLAGGLATVSDAVGGLRMLMWPAGALGSCIPTPADPGARRSVSDSVMLFAMRRTICSPECSTLAAAPRSPEAEARRRDSPSSSS